MGKFLRKAQKRLKIRQDYYDRQNAQFQKEHKRPGSLKAKV